MRRGRAYSKGPGRCPERRWPRRHHFVGLPSDVLRLLRIGEKGPPHRYAGRTTTALKCFYCGAAR